MAGTVANRCMEVIRLCKQCKDKQLRDISAGIALILHNVLKIVCQFLKIT